MLIYVSYETPEQITDFLYRVTQKDVYP